MRRASVFALLMVFTFAVSFAVAGFISLAHATSAVNGIAADQPLGTSSSPQVISGTYSFLATVTDASGTVSSVTFFIDGFSYTPSLVSTKTAPGPVYYDKYGYNLVTGAFSNGEYSWYGQAVIGGKTYTSSTEYFQISNSITISFSAPSSGTQLSGNVAVLVTAKATSSNTVQTVAGSIGGINFPMSSDGNSQWSGAFNSRNVPNGIFQLTVSATGSGSITGSAGEPVNIANAGPSNWVVSYVTSLGTFSGSDFAQMSGQTSNEGPATTSLGQLQVFPNSNTEKVEITVPQTVPSMDTYYFPLDASPYYSFNGTYAANWTDQGTNPLTMSGVTVGNNSPYGTPSVSVPSSGTPSITSSLDFGPQNISKGQWTFGMIFYTSVSFEFSSSATSMYSSFVSGTSGPFHIVLQLSNATSGVAEYTLETNMTFNEKQWYAFAFTDNGVNGGNVLSYSNLKMYVDGQQIGYTVSTIYSGSEGFTGFGKTLVNGAFGETLAGIFAASALLAPSQIHETQVPAPWQVYAPVQPSYLSVTQSYYSIVIINGTQPWSQIGIYVLNVITGQMATVSLSYDSPIGLQNFFTYTTTITYAPFMSLQSFTENLTVNPFFVPLDSFLDIRVYNQFSQVVGTISNYEVNTSQSAVTVNLNLTELLFSFVNTSEQQVILSANGISASFFGQGIVANNTEYQWSSTVFVNGKSVQYEGTVSTYEVTQTLTIYAGAPEAGFQVLIFGYGPSGVNELQTGGQPYVRLFINGIHWQSSATWNTSIGSILNVTINDVLNQTLYHTNFTVLNPENTLVANITTPSWILSLTNDEQANQTSPLATETIYVNNTATGARGVFKDSIGQNLELYLLQGNYTLYLHDNATFKTSIDLNSSQYYVIFAQHLLTVQQFDALENSIYNNTAHLQVLAVNVPVSSLPFEEIIYHLTFAFPNGTSLSAGNVHALIQNGTFAVYNSTTGKLARLVSEASDGVDGIYANFSISSIGQYTVSYSSSLSSGGHVFSVRYSNSLIVSNTLQFSVGMEILVAGPSTVQIKHNTTYTVTLMYSNGTVFSLLSTIAAAKNMTVDSYIGKQFYATYAPVVVSAGKVTFVFNTSRTADYVIVVSVSRTTVAQSNDSAQSSIAVSAVNYNPSQNQFSQSISAFINEYGLVLTVLTGTVAVIYGAYRVLDKRRLEDKGNEAQIENVPIADTVWKWLNGQKLTPVEAHLLSSIKPDVLLAIVKKLDPANVSRFEARINRMVQYRIMRQQKKQFQGGNE